MKSKLNSILLLSVIFSGVLSVSCQKEQITSKRNEIPANDLKIANMIKNFKTRGESGFKSTTEMTVDSAIWFIGASANFTYGNASHKSERTWSDSIFITLPVNNGKISEGVVFNKYEAAIDSLREIYQGRNEENKQLLSVGITTHSVSTNELVCKVTGTFAYGFPTTSFCNFNNADSYCFWYYWQYQAICDGNTGYSEVTDAAEETQKYIMRCKAVPAGNYWYENQITKYVPDPSAYPIDPTVAPGNYRYAHMYWNSSQYPNFNGCIPPDDLNFYLSKTKELINTDTTQGGLRLPGYSLIDIDIRGFIESNNSYTIYKHKADIKYGILHLSIDPPQSLE